MDFSLSTDVARELKRIKQKHPLLFKMIQKQLKLFKEDIHHPSLRTHKLKGNLTNTWSISIEGNFRLIYFVENNEVVFFKVGSHDELYRK